MRPDLVMEAARARQAGRTCGHRRPRARRGRRRGDARLRRARAFPSRSCRVSPTAVGVPAYAGVPLRDAQGDRRPLRRRAYGAATGAGPRSARATATVVVSATLDSVAAAAGELVAAGRKPDTPLTVTVAGTTTRQRTWTATLGTIAQILKQAKVLPSPEGGQPVIAVVGERSAAAQRDAARVVRVQAAVRLEGARAAYEGAGGVALRPAALATAPCRTRCRRSPSSRRARRSRWSGRSRGW